MLVVKKEIKPLLDLDLTFLSYDFRSFINKVIAYFKRKLIVSNLKNLLILFELLFDIYIKDDFSTDDEDMKKSYLELINKLNTMIEITEQRIEETKNARQQYTLELKEYYEKILYLASAFHYILTLRANENRVKQIGENFFNLLNSDDFDVYEFGKGLYLGSKVEL